LTPVAVGSGGDTRHRRRRHVHGCRLDRRGVRADEQGADATERAGRERDRCSDRRWRPTSAALRTEQRSTNALLERKGARTAFVATRGFEHLLHLRRQSRAHLYRLDAAHPEALLPVDRCFGVEERIGPDEVLVPLDLSTLPEMGAVLVRSAFSPNIKERRDCSTALFDMHGRMITQAEHIPVHLGAMPEAVRAVMAHDPQLVRRSGGFPTARIAPRTSLSRSTAS
jgi:hypothetical protein